MTVNLKLNDCRRECKMDRKRSTRIAYMHRAERQAEFVSSVLFANCSVTWESLRMR